MIRMRTLTNDEQGKLQWLTAKSVEFTLLQPTETGLKKSIMDATGPVRTYLKEQGIHDFNSQGQGPSEKVLIESILINGFSTKTSTCSLYRPITKNGDPRIWFTGLREIASANDILALIWFDARLYVVNITKHNLSFLIGDSFPNPLQDLVNAIHSDSTVTARELLALLRGIASMGPVPALLQADTAIGRTLETLLGIDINSSRKPDYKGIELKSFRAERNNRKTLFAQVPDWSESKFKSSTEILNAFGYARDNDFKLYCTVSTLVRNSQGLKLKLDNKIGRLIENSDNIDIGDFVVWDLEKLHQRLLEKHNETFWISANSIIEDGKEYFHYNKVEHTRKPIVSQFDILLDQGFITLDHLIKRNHKGGGNEKGPLFRIKEIALALLFPPSQIYDLQAEA